MRSSTGSDLSGLLRRWYRKSRRALPWRETSDPYKIWISEVMLQQTTVAAVIPYYQRWLRTFPSVHDVASAPLGRVLRHWQGLGYYARARNIHKSSKIIVNQYAGRLPGQAAVLRRLPGFGTYTTAAVLSIAFGQPHPVIDANVRRVVSRLLAIRSAKPLAVDLRISAFLKTSLPFSGAGEFNQALMELGALVCRPLDPLCGHCPWHGSCRAKHQGIQQSLPVKQKKVFKKIRTVVAVLRKEKRIFFQRRSEKGLLAGFWELPGGKIEKNESPEKALARELKEELGVKVKKTGEPVTVKHAYTSFQVTLLGFECEAQPAPRTDSKHRWFSPKELEKYPVPCGTLRLLRRMKWLCQQDFKGL
ncbi:MAG: A/G-specific adenine glycosylase [Candidatus Omnitrophota bacterium]